MADPTKVLEFAVDKLKPHRVNEFIYQDRADDDLIDSVRAHGILTPLQATGNGKTIVSGHRRLDAAKRLNMDTVPVIFLSKMFPEDETELLIEMNRQRPKTNEQKVREAQVLTDCENKRRRRLRQEASGGEQPEFEKSVRQTVAEKLGVSEMHTQRLVSVGNAMDAAEESGNQEAVEEIRNQVNQSVKKAAESVAKPKKSEPRPDAWDFDREGTIIELEAAEAAVGEAARCVKSAVEAHGNPSDHSRRCEKKIMELRVLLQKWKEGVR